MATTPRLPRGVEADWRNKENEEYQLFPSSFFDGADVKIYLGDVWLDDIVSITFAIQEQVKPLKGYGSRTFKQVSRGSRIVMGRFAVAFREAGWISSILDHIGQLTPANAQPEVQQWMAGNTKSQWTARALQRYEAFMYEQKGDKGAAQVRYSAYEREIWGRATSNDPDQSNITYFNRSRTNNDEWQKSVAEKGFDIYLIYGAVEQEMQINSNATTTSFESTVKAIRGIQLTGSSQTITAGDTVLEVFDFIAKDVD